MHRIKAGRTTRAAFWLLLLLSSSALADESSRARIAQAAGSERLQIFSYGKLLQTGTAPGSVVEAMRQDMIRQGFYFDPGTTPLVAADAWVAPILSYDGNINGGVLQDSFTYGGQVFEAGQEFRAKAGVVMGASAGGLLRLAWENGRYVEASARGEAVWAPQFGIGRSNTELALCSRNHLTGWTFLDLCNTISGVRRELGSSSSNATDLALSQIFDAGGAYHEVTADLSDTRFNAGNQPALTLSWNAIWNGAATKFSVTAGAPFANQMALRRRISTEVSWLLQDRMVSVDLWHQDADGGAFLGASRADVADGVGLSYEFRPRLTAQIGYTVNHSNVDFFRYEQLSLNVRFDALRW